MGVDSTAGVFQVAAYVLSSLAIGFIVARKILEARAQLTVSQGKVEQLQARSQELQNALQRGEQKIEELIQKVEVKSIELEASKGNAQVLLREKALLEHQVRELGKIIEEVPKRSKVEFENLANQILELKGKAFEERSMKNLEGVFGSLREKIDRFEKSVEEKYGSEAKERHVLKAEIDRLITLNETITRETSSLTKALRGDSKTQGDWGEMVLAKILENSGLRAGEEYIEQQSIEGEQGQRLRPDVVIHLPEGKHLIIDSKVSLRAYDRFHQCENDAERLSHLKSHIKDIESHVLELSERHYNKLKGVQSPEFVFMFVPVEPAYLAAMHEDPDLATRAWKRGVALVTATTLFTSLKTVAHIWRVEKQNRNAQEIADEGGRLYDKFVGFLEDFEKMGATFEAGQRQYLSAMNKLRDGQGNVFRKIERLRELGAAPSKSIKSEYLEG